MPATVEDLQFVRRYVGTSLSDGDLYAKIESQGSAALAAQDILMTRRADLANGPTSFSVPGYSENNLGALSTIEMQLKELEALTGVGGESGPAVFGQLTRADRCGR